MIWRKDVPSLQGDTTGTVGHVYLPEKMKIVKVEFYLIISADYWYSALAHLWVTKKQPIGAEK